MRDHIDNSGRSTTKSGKNSTENSISSYHDCRGDEEIVVYEDA